MKKLNKKKLWIFVAGFALTSNAIYFAFRVNFPAVIWVLCSAFLFYQVTAQDIMLQQNYRWIQKSKKINTKLTNRLIIEQGKNEAMLANCKRYQDELKKLRRYDGRNNDKTAE